MERVIEYSSRQGETIKWCQYRVGRIKLETIDSKAFKLELLCNELEMNASELDFFDFCRAFIGLKCYYENVDDFANEFEFIIRGITCWKT